MSSPYGQLENRSLPPQGWECWVAHPGGYMGAKCLAGSLYPQCPEKNQPAGSRKRSLARSYYSGSAAINSFQVGWRMGPARTVATSQNTSVNQRGRRVVS
jgi:hypothetical protein